MAIKALIYCRVSSARQKMEGHGLESQEHRCRKYAADRGYEVEKVFGDSFTGGGDFMRRPAMAMLLGYLDSKPQTNYVVIFDDLKRFARDVTFHWKLRQEFQARGTKVECLNFNFEDSPEGEFVETIMAAQGELERKQNRRQVIQKQKARMEKGYWTFYPPPGMDYIQDLVHGKLLVPKEPQASQIREAMEGFVSGRFVSQVDVQKYFRSVRFLGNRPIYLELIKRIFTRVLYAGYIEYPEWDIPRVKGQHQAIVSLEIFEAVQRKLAGKVQVRIRKDYSEDFPLRGFVVCDFCSEPLTASWSKGRFSRYPYYRCRNLRCGAHNLSIPRAKLEEEFNDILRRIKPKRAVLQLTVLALRDVWQQRLASAKELTRQYEGELREVRRKIDGLLNRIAKAQNESLAGAYERELEKLAIQEQSLTERVENPHPLKADFETALNRVFSILENPYEYWAGGSKESKQLLLKLVFTGPLKYEKFAGFGTANLSLPFRVFELSKVENSRLVEVGRIELPSENATERESTTRSEH